MEVQDLNVYQFEEEGGINSGRIRPLEQKFRRVTEITSPVETEVDKYEPSRTIEFDNEVD